MARRIVSQSRLTGTLSAEEQTTAKDMARTLRASVRRIAGTLRPKALEVVAQYETQADGSVRRVLVVSASQREALTSSWHGAIPEPNSVYLKRVEEKGIGFLEQRAVNRCYSAQSHTNQ